MDVTTSYMLGTSGGPNIILTFPLTLTLVEEGVKDAWSLDIFMKQPIFKMGRDKWYLSGEGRPYHIFPG